MSHQDNSIPSLLLSMGMFVDMDGKIVWASKHIARNMNQIYQEKQKADDTRGRLKAKLEARKKN